MDVSGNNVEGADDEVGRFARHEKVGRATYSIRLFIYFPVHTTHHLVSKTAAVQCSAVQFSAVEGNESIKRTEACLIFLFCSVLLSPSLDLLLQFWFFSRLRRRHHQWRKSNNIPSSLSSQQQQQPSEEIGKEKDPNPPLLFSIPCFEDIAPPPLQLVSRALISLVILGKPGEILDGIFDCIHDITAALIFAARMNSESAYRVDTAPRLAQWRIDSLASCTYRKSDPFKIGIWNWHLSVEKNRVLHIKLYPVISNFNRDQPPIASFIIRLRCSVGDHKVLVHPGVVDKLLKNNDDFVWAIETPLVGKVIIDVEFLNLKIADPNGGEPCSIWTGSHFQSRSNTTALSSLGRMLAEGIHTDITINASDGSITAHRAVLATRSPVFHSMFSHNLKEKELSTIDIPDMSAEACQSFLNYIYGNVQHEEFLAHRLALLQAADKYDIADLKEACHDSLLEDIDAKNVLERLQNASLYQLPILKSSCLRYLIQFGKIFDIRDDFNAFLQSADRDLIAEIFQEVLGAWKGF